MWHDFIQESEGCGSGEPLVEAQEALQTAATFLNATSYEQGGCAVQCSKARAESAASMHEGDGDGTTLRSQRAKMSTGNGLGFVETGGAAVVHWHYRYNYKPPATQADCRGIW